MHRISFKIFILLILALCETCFVFSSVFAAEPNPEADKLWDFANGLFIRGKSFYTEAAQQYKEFLSKYPNDERAETATFRLGECYRLDGKYKEAYETYVEHKKFANSKDRDKVDFRTGQVLYYLNKPSDALTYLEPLSKKELQGELKDMVFFYFGRSLIDSGKIDEGVKTLTPIAVDEKSQHRIFAAYYIASGSMKAGNLDQAAQFFKTVADSKSSLAPEALFRLGEINIKQNKLDDGCRFYNQLVETFPQSEYVPYAVYGILWARFTANQYDECINQYEKQGKLISKEVKPEVLYLVGNCYYETGKYDKAVDLYLTIPKDFPDSTYAGKARYKTCWSFFMLKKYNEAISYCEAYIKDNPKGEDADKLHFLAADSNLALKNYDKALIEFQQVVEKFPQSIFLKDSLFKLAWCQFEKKDYEEAKKRFAEFIEKYPDHERAPEALVRAAECNVSLAKGKPASKKELGEQAVKDYEAFLQKYPNNAAREEVLFQLAIQYVELEQADRAISTFQTLVDAFPSSKRSCDAYYWISREYQKKKDYDKAIPALEKSITASAEGQFRNRAQYQLAAIYHERGDFDKAAEILLPMLAKNPEFEIPQQTQIWAAGYLRGKGKIDESIGLYDRFLKKYPTSELAESAYYGIGECYSAQSKFAEAVGNYIKAVELNGPSSRDSKLALGISYVKTGKYGDANILFAELSKCEVPELEAKALFWLGTIELEEAKKEADQKTRADKCNKARLEFMKVEILYTNSELRAESMFRTAESFELAGDVEEASKQYQKIIEAYPNNPFSEEAKKKLNAGKPQ
jgi:TolA-binding protein